ncbi:MAG: long-chain-fatty-acid--CoA ligase [Geminicoccaceae bacterium]|nr:long-chain-fatty-acid--CoA ligase [Geminicoccaceae bacterium]
MRGLMMDRPLLISSILDYAADYHGAAEVVSCAADRPPRRITYAALRGRVRQLANALRDELGVAKGDRIATLAWNDHRHVELYYAVAGIGAICHTVNPRLFPDQIAYIVAHAEDRYLFTDAMFLPLLERLAPRLTSVQGIFVLGEEADLPATALKVRAYESLIAGHPAELEWPSFDETTACGLCYTSATTGNPKGALYHHRSTVLHALAIALPDAMGLSSRETVLPVVPMFHVNAWGLPYACPLVGARMVMPGPRLDGASLFEAFERERVTFASGVPTIWFGLLNHLKETGRRPTSLRRVVIGGAAAPRSMIETFEKDYGIEVLHGWGMTEMSPVGAVCSLDLAFAALPDEERFRIKQKQGHAIWGVEFKIVDEHGRRLPHDGKAAGVLYVRGPWIASAYFRDEQASAEALDAEGWFSTGDVATIDSSGYMQITDRAKDMIRSGGEWISSIALENAAVGHPGLAEAAAIAAAHPKWGERPLLVAVRRAGARVEKADVIAFLGDKVASWWLPDDVVFVDELPHTATGKIKKSVLRERFAGYRLPTA